MAIYRHLVYIILKVLPWKFCNMKWKNWLKVITKAEGLILFTTNFYVTDVIYIQCSQSLLMALDSSSFWNASTGLIGVYHIKKTTSSISPPLENESRPSCQHGSYSKETWGPSPNKVYGSYFLAIIAIQPSKLPKYTIIPCQENSQGFTVLVLSFSYSISLSLCQAASSPPLQNKSRPSNMRNPRHQPKSSDFSCYHGKLVFFHFASELQQVFDEEKSDQ